MILDKMKKIHEKLGELYDGYELLTENWDDTQRVLEMSGFEGDSEEKVSLFTRLLAPKLCMRIIRFIMICSLETIAVALALSFKTPIFADQILLVLSPFVVKFTVDGILRDLFWNC